MKFAKKVVLIFIFLLSFALPAKSDEIDECKAFFNQYIQKSNNYAPDFPDLFASDAKIKRVRVNDKGKVNIKILTKTAYVQKLKRYAALAKLVKYKNKFHNISYTKERNVVRITGSRTPSTSSGENYNVFFIVGKDKNGDWKILEDFTETKNKLAF